VIRWLPVLAFIAILGAPDLAVAQAANPAGPNGLNPASPYLPNPTGPAASVPGSANMPGAGAPYAPNPTSVYGSNPANYASSPESEKRRLSPQQRASQQQSGLTEAQVRALLQSKGYGQIVSVEADPNSLWVWQADALKDGRPVRIGIDYRGDVLQLSGGQAQPCTQPGVQLGPVGGLGVGSHLAQADSCSGH